MTDQPTEREQVALGPETGHDADRHIGEMGVVSEGLPREDVSEVDFDEGDPYCKQSVANRDARVGVRRGVYQETGESRFGRLDPVDKLALYVRLKKGDLCAKLGSKLDQAPVDRLEVYGAVFVWLAPPQEVQIGAVEDPNA